MKISCYLVYYYRSPYWTIQNYYTFYNFYYQDYKLGNCFTHYFVHFLKKLEHNHIKSRIKNLYLFYSIKNLEKLFNSSKISISQGEVIFCFSIFISWNKSSNFRHLNDKGIILAENLSYRSYHKYIFLFSIFALRSIHSSLLEDSLSCFIHFKFKGYLQFLNDSS